MIGQTHGGKGGARRDGKNYRSEHERIYGDSVDVTVNGSSASSKPKRSYVFDNKMGRLKLVE